MGKARKSQVLISDLSMLLRRKEFEKLLTELKRHILKKWNKIFTDFKHVR